MTGESTAELGVHQVVGIVVVLVLIFMIVLPFVAGDWCRAQKRSVGDRAERWGAGLPGIGCTKPA